MESLEARQLMAAQVYSGPLAGKVVYTSAGHGWEYDAGLGRYATGRGDSLEIEEAFGNQDQLSFYADYILRAGGTVVPMRPVGNQTNEVVLDNDSAGVTFSGPWTNSASSAYYDEDYGAATDAVPYRSATANTTAETAVATYQPNIPQAGFYPVYTWALGGSNRTNQLYRVNHSGGATEIRVDHRNVGRGWVYLGTYHFAAGSNAGANVQISNFSPAGGNVIADAIRFGNGMGDYRDGPTVSGHPREDEASLLWIARSLGVGTSLSTAAGTSNVSAPSNFAEWMNSAPFGTSVYIGFHSNAGGGRGARGLVDSDQATPHQLDLATYTGRQINQDMQALDGVFEHNWVDGVPHTYTAGFGEIDLGANAEMDATIIEVGFHDSTLDAQLMRDPKVRDQLGRSTYEATLEYFDIWGALPTPIVQPDEPTNVRAVANAAGDLTISWTAPASRTGGPAAATGYRVYSSRNGYGFGNPVAVAGVGTTSLTIPAAQLDGDAYYFKVAATNAGGESPASVVVGARQNGAGGGGGANRILVVNGFDRNERSQNQRYAYAHTSDGLVDRVRLRYNNSFDYVVQAGEAIEAYAAGGVALGFDSVQNEQVANGTVNLASYPVVIWLAGEESTTDETFGTSEQSRINAFIGNGGRLFVSGAEIAWDLDRPAGTTGPTAADASFYNNTLKADYLADDGGSYAATGVATSIFNGVSLSFGNGTNGFYDTDSPDRVAAFGAGATVAMNYASPGSGGAAVQWANPAAGTGGARVVNMAFPFEMITTPANRNTVMARVLNFFEAAVSATPGTPDLVASSDTGSSDTDNLTNRDNGSNGTLQFSVTGTVAGATIELFSGGMLIGTAPGVAGTTVVTTSGSVVLADGARAVTARQKEPSKSASATSGALTVNVDTVSPTVQVAAVAPDPRDTPVDSMTIVFSRPVTGFGVTDLLLTRNNSPVALGAAQAPVTSDGMTFVVSNLAALTTAAGTYSLSIHLGEGDIATAAGNRLTTGGSDVWTKVASDTTAPAVTGVFVGSTAWTQAFRDHLVATVAGESDFGYRILAGAQTDELPWVNADQVSIRFSEHVDVAMADLVVSAVGSPTGPQPVAFSYDEATFTGTWTLSRAIDTDKVLFNLDADPGTGGVADAANNPLDGEWANPTAPAVGDADTFPSGNEVAGGDFRFRVNVLPGDVNRNGSVSATDLNLVKLAQGAATGGGLYTIFKDVNGSGSVMANDVNLVRGRQGAALPPGDPAAPAELAPAVKLASSTPKPVVPSKLEPTSKKRLTEGLV